MTANDLLETAGQESPPAGLGLLVEAMWWQAHGDWARAHRMVDELSTRDGAWVHAYLHRVEGDLANAAYWYREAARPVCRLTLDKEWDEIVEALVKDVDQGSRS